MAKAKVINPVPVPQPEPTVELTLTMKEARALLVVQGKIGGPPDSSARGEWDKIGKALRNAGVKAPCEHTEPYFRIRSTSVYFVPDAEDYYGKPQPEPYPYNYLRRMYDCNIIKGA